MSDLNLTKLREIANAAYGRELDTTVRNMLDLVLL